MGDPRIGALDSAHVVERAFVMKLERLPSVRKEDGVPVRTAWLEPLDRIVVLGNKVRAIGLLRVVQRIDLLAQHRALESPAGLARFP